MVSDFSDYMTEVVTLDGWKWIYNAGEFSWLDKIPKTLWSVIAKSTKEKINIYCLNSPYFIIL